MSRASRWLSRWVVLLSTAVWLAGCQAAGPVNPSFAVEIDEAEAALRQMAAEPTQLDRPVVVLAGFMDPGLLAMALADELRHVTGDEAVMSVAFLTSRDFDACAARVVEAVDQAHPGLDPYWTREVDVVGISMGGLVAGYAASPAFEGADGRRLRIRRLFTISTPHRGAELASLPTVDQRQLAMRSGSAFLEAVAEHLETEPYELFPYVRLGDTIMGEANAAPAGRSPWWVPPPPLDASHVTAYRDPRIVADIARRLRGEAPFTTEPAAPLPEER